MIATKYLLQEGTKAAAMADDSKAAPEKEGETKDDVQEPKKEEEEDNNQAATTTAEAIEIRSPSPGISVSLLVFWVLPIMILAFCSHLAFDKDKSFQLNIPEDRKVSVDLTGGAMKKNQKKPKMNKPSSTPGKKNRSPSPPPSPLPSAHSNWPTSYRGTIDTIQKRNRKVPRIGTTSSGGTASNSNNNQKKDSPPKDTKSTPSKKRPERPGSGAFSRDPARQQYEDRIADYRQDFEGDPENVLKAIKLADALRLYDVTYHDGGTKQPEAIATYERAIAMTVAKRERMVEAGEDTTLSLSGTRNVREEVMKDYSQKSVDGLLCAMYTAKGKVYFMANMFERAVESYSECLELEPLYLDALG